MKMAQMNTGLTHTFIDFYSGNKARFLYHHLYKFATERYQGLQLVTRLDDSQANLTTCIAMLLIKIEKLRLQETTYKLPINRATTILNLKRYSTTLLIANFPYSNIHATPMNGDVKLNTIFAASPYIMAMYTKKDERVPCQYYNKRWALHFFFSATVVLPSFSYE
ncbi:hypothetical protein ACJX0J_007040, partial [Zea mays]